MTRAQMLEQIRRINAQWHEKYADAIPNRFPGGYRPHDGQTDAAEHHALISAPPRLEEELQRQIDAVIAQYQSDSNPDRGK